MQLLRCCLSIALIYTTLVLLAIQQVAWAQDRSEVGRLREEQMQLGCQLKYNESLRSEFFYSIGNKQGIQIMFQKFCSSKGVLSTKLIIITLPQFADTRISRHSERIDINLRCWAIKYCPGASTSWCIHLYHPEKSIELCYNSTGHVTRMTEAAAALMLQEKFEISPEVCIQIKHKGGTQIFTCYCDRVQVFCG